MKERYFTPENISVTAAEMRAQLGTLVKARPLNSQQAVLLVLDMQQYFLDPASHAYIPSAPVILPHLQQLIAAFSQRQRPVIFTQHLNTPENAGSMARWWRDLITVENLLSAISPTLDFNAHPVIVKSQYDAFHNTDLENRLRQQNISQLVIGGVMTHLCCETTARAAFTRGFEVFFLIDGTATYNASFHRASLLNLAHGFAMPVLTPQILEALNENTA
ncbi:MAG TPA: isochorismatase [Chloroflexi bacterium]|nr:isochorismatase [Chloroflexota bacterium]